MVTGNSASDSISALSQLIGKVRGVMRHLRFTDKIKGNVEGLTGQGGKEGNELSTEAEYPQFDSVLEMVESAGDELSETEREVLAGLKAPKLTVYVNSRVRQSAKQAVTNAINSADKALGVDKILSDARSAGHDWSIANSRSRGTGVTAKAAAFDDIMRRARAGETVSPEELASLATQFGI